MYVFSQIVFKRTYKKLLTGPSLIKMPLYDEQTSICKSSYSILCCYWQQILLYYQLAANNWKIRWYIFYFGLATCNILLFSYYYEDKTLLVNGHNGHKTARITCQLAVRMVMALKQSLLCSTVYLYQGPGVALHLKPAIT